MSRTPWEFDNYQWPINPDEDKGWNFEHVISENVPIGSRKSSIQFTSTKSARRQISGWLWGPNAQEQFNKLRTWNRNLTLSVLTDHLGESVSARLVKLDIHPVISASEWKMNRQTWRYDAEFLSAE